MAQDHQHNSAQRDQAAATLIGRLGCLLGQIRTDLEQFRYKVGAMVQAAEPFVVKEDGAVPWLNDQGGEVVDQHEELVREVVDRIRAAANEADELARVSAGVLGFALPEPAQFVTQMRTVLREIIDWFYAPVGWEGYDGNDFGATTYNPEFNATPNVIAFRFSEKYDDRLRKFERVLESIPLHEPLSASPEQAVPAPSTAKPAIVQTPSKVVADRPTHNPDFTSVDWYGTPYTFRGHQAKIVEMLWEAGDVGLSEATLAEDITHKFSRFRVDHIFRDRKNKKMHPAWGTMIVRIDKAIYRLAFRPATK